ncbi:hypothetical protein H920_13815 [Fukomys damarensis]|uniref:Uncharacterized protein n=1 Tax=Fukomys damarensis TaxID=885580 RepID=A0A091CYC8_FUKDA|nr:hypothetical protein H920_13815 [Fukomys damarensis]
MLLAHGPTGRSQELDEELAGTRQIDSTITGYLCLFYTTLPITPDDEGLQERSDLRGIRIKHCSKKITRPRSTARVTLSNEHHDPAFILFSLKRDDDIYFSVAVMMKSSPFYL